MVERIECIKCGKELLVPPRCRGPRGDDFDDYASDKGWVDFGDGWLCNDCSWNLIVEEAEEAG